MFGSASLGLNSSESLARVSSSSKQLFVDVKNIISSPGLEPKSLEYLHKRQDEEHTSYQNPKRWIYTCKVYTFAHVFLQC